MRRSLFQAFLAAILLFCAQAYAQPTAVVEGVQMPAWVERAGQRQPLMPGMFLPPGALHPRGHLHPFDDGGRLRIGLSAEQQDCGKECLEKRPSHFSTPLVRQACRIQGLQRKPCCSGPL